MVIKVLALSGYATSKHKVRIEDQKSARRFLSQRLLLNAA